MSRDNLLVSGKDKLDSHWTPLELKESFLNNEIRHLEQATKNDCGVACLKMALNYLYKNESESTRDSHVKQLDILLGQLGIDKISLWTIDIAHICAINNFRHQMYTITLGVDENYSSEHFYAVDSDFEIEKQRIRDKFSKRAELGIHVLQKSLPLSYLKHELCQKSVCIILVNANLLHGHNIDSTDNSLLINEICTKFASQSHEKKCCCFLNPMCRCDSVNKKRAVISSGDLNVVSSAERGTSHGPPLTSSIDLDNLVNLNLNNERASNNYSGHFIVLIGYDDSKQVVFYRNPASKRNLSYTSYLNFEIARKSYGTDQDLLFIYS